MDQIVQAYKGVSHWVSSQFIWQKLNNPLGYIVLTIIGLMFGYAISVLPITFAIVLLLVLLGIPLIFLCLTDLVFGMGLILFIAVFMGLPTKYVNMPLGTSLDLILFLLFIGLLLKQIKERSYKFLKNQVSAVILIWVAYNVLQVLNPWAQSQMAWLFSVRSMGGLILLYFVACYALNSKRIIFNILKIIIGLAFVSALYGLKQEWIGFSDQEMTWLMSDPERFELIFQWSRIRIFSFFSDPTNFGIYMSYVGTFCLILATGPFKLKAKIFLVFAALTMFLAMAFAGSRTPFVLIPAGLVMFVLMTFKKSHFLGFGFFLFCGALFVMKSTSNAVIFRIQSAFDPTKSDDTIQVRLKNQEYIQPFIWAHPFGAGMGSTGIWGKRFTPNSKLADFAHDSGFVRIAVELGWIGLLLYGLLLFTILRKSIYYYVRVKDPLIKTIYLGLSVIVFQLTLASYPQEAIIILPTSITFYILVAMTVRLKDFDSVAMDEKDQDNRPLRLKGPKPQRLKRPNFLNRHKS